MLRTIALILLFSACTAIHPVFGSENAFSGPSDSDDVVPDVIPEGSTAKRVGIDLGILPTYNITANFRLDFE